MNEYDKTVLMLVAVLTAAVFLLLALLVGLFDISPIWFFMPAGWWVGAMMVWAYGKYQDRNGPVAQR